MKRKIHYKDARREALEMLEWNDIISNEKMENPTKPLSEIREEWVDLYIFSLEEDGYEVVR